MASRDMLRVFILTKIQEAIDAKNWPELRIMYGFLKSISQKEADAIYEKMPEEVRKQLLNYYKGHGNT